MIKSRKISVWIILLIFLSLMICLIYWASNNMLWLGDNYYYQFIFERNQTPLGADSPTPIRDIQDILYSLHNHYYNYNGRLFTHFFVQLFCGLLGHKWFAFFNCIAYLVLIYSIADFIDRTRNPKTLLTATFLIIISLITTMVPSTQISYVWTAILNIFFISLFFKDKKYGSISLCFLAILGLCAGNSHEAYSIGISGAIVIFGIINRKKLGKTRYILSISYIIGTLSVCLSPAAIERSATSNVDPIQSIFFFIFSLRAIYILLFILLYKCLYKKHRLKDIYTPNAFLFNTLIICILFNLTVGVFCNRQLFGAELMAILIILRILKNKSFTSFWLVIFGVLSLLEFSLQAQKMYLYINQKQRILLEYQHSEDGIVYQDTWQPGLLNWWADHIFDNSFNTRSFQKMIKSQYPNCPAIIILPTYFKDKIDQNLPNTIYHFKYKPGKVLIIQSKQDPAKFYVDRKFFDIIPYQVREMDFSSPIYENQYWRAIIYEELTPVIYNTDAYLQ